MEWKVLKEGQEYLCPDSVTLKEWAAAGRIQREDYIFNPILGQWLYARDVAEVQGSFAAIQKQGQAGQLKKIAIALGILGLVFLVMVPAFGCLLLIGAGVCGVMHHVKAGTVI